MPWARYPTHVRVPSGLSDDVLRGPLRTVHVGHSVVLLSRPGAGLLPVTSWCHGLVPGGICLADDTEFRAVAGAASGRPVLDLSDWAPVVRAAPRQDLTVRRGPIAQGAARALLTAALEGAGRPPRGPMDATPLRSRAASLVRAAHRGDGRDVRLVLEDLVGAGPGSTPAGDDVVVGVLAALDRQGCGDAAATIRAVLPDLLPRTTTASRHELEAALASQVAERVHTLLAALAHPGLVRAAVRAARTWGASSGLDLASGVAAGASCPAAAPTDVTTTLRRSA